MVTEISYPRDTIMGMVGGGYQEAPSGRARRVKKICLWHIFSQSGKQAMLATWAEGWRRRRLRESALQYSRCQSKVARAPSVIFLRKCHLPPGGRLLVSTVDKHPHRGLNYRFLLPVGDIQSTAGAATGGIVCVFMPRTSWWASLPQ